MTSYTFRWKTASTLDEALAHIHNKCEGLIYKRKDAGAEVTKLLTDALSGKLYITKVPRRKESG